MGGCICTFNFCAYALWKNAVPGPGELPANFYEHLWLDDFATMYKHDIGSETKIYTTYVALIVKI